MATSSNVSRSAETQKKTRSSAKRYDAILPVTTLARIYTVAALAIGLGYLLQDAQIRTSLRWWWAAIGLVAAAIVVFLFLPVTSKWLHRLSPTKRAVFVIYFLIPLVIIFIVCVAVFLASGYQANVLRVVFLAVVILLPATMYYLFIATRKVSLLNEFINNLDRLGLLRVQEKPSVALSDEDQRNRELTIGRRFESYRRKFEALYGPISSDDLQRAFLGDGGSPPPSMPGVVESDKTGSLFTSETAVPVVTASILVALGWILILPLKRADAFLADPSVAGAPAKIWLLILKPEEVPVYFAFLGAYFFSLQMLFRRYVLRDLRPSAYVAVAMRIILAVVGTWVVAIANQYKLLNIQDNTLLIVGFVIGVFPSLAWQFVQAVFKKITFAGFFIPSLKTQLPISDLDGLTVWHEARLEEEDIENIPNMATADLVEMMLQTRFPPDRIIDWVDQAILYTHLGPEATPNGGKSARKRLREHGIRTATSLVETYRKACVTGDTEAFEKILSDSDGGRSPIRGLVDAVGTNPNFPIIWIWRGLPDEEYKTLTASAQGTVTYREPLHLDRTLAPKSKTGSA